MKEDIREAEGKISAEISKHSTLKELTEYRSKIFGRNGMFNELSGKIKSVPSEERSEMGKSLNSFKQTLTHAFDDAEKTLKAKEISQEESQEWIDVTANYDPFDKGGIHPVSTVQYELEDIFTAMGFYIMDGPHIDSEYYNFEALNIPKDHPARDMQDTFYLGNNDVLRTQTSTLQIRAMEIMKPPIRVIGPGKVFRAERIDATHECCFHQIEGMVIDKDISVANLIYFTRVMLSQVFKDDVKIRLRPGYFPFVEPGFEVELACSFCKNKGCRICKYTGWMEIMGCGMVHPNVLRVGNIDPEVYSGFAFGIGIERLVMNRYNIHDIRYFHNPDLRFHRFFS